MGTVIPQTKYEILPPGTYRVRLTSAAVQEGPYGTQVVMGFDLMDEDQRGRFVKAWAAAKLSGGRRPSKLYSWTSALLFGGKPLPEEYDLDTDALLRHEALALIEVIERDGLLYNRIVQLFPWRPAKGAEVAPASAPPVAASAQWEWDEGPESPEILDDEVPW